MFLFVSYAYWANCYLNHTGFQKFKFKNEMKLNYLNIMKKEQSQFLWL